MKDRSQLIIDAAEMLNNPKISLFTKAETLRKIIIPVLTGMDKVKIGYKYWSDAAIKKYSASGNTKTLIHEHVVPKQYFIDWLNGINPYWDHEGIRMIFDAFLVAAVITKEEDTILNGLGLRCIMPKEFDEPGIDDTLYCNPWSRYIKAGIRIFEVDWNDKLIASAKEINLLEQKVDF